MTIKNIAFFSLLFVTSFISARKQIAPNLIKKLVAEIAHNNSQQKNYAYKQIIADHTKLLNKYQTTK
jgi:hypothetical protein